MIDICPLDGQQSVTIRGFFFRDDNKGDDVALCYPLILANVQRTMTAPTTAVTISPSQPKALMPKRPKSHQPTVPPMSPRKRLTRQPLPSPFCILLAMYPAIMPVIIPLIIIEYVYILMLIIT